MPFKKMNINSRSNQLTEQQLNSGDYSDSTWQDEVTNIKWKLCHLPYGVSSNLNLLHRMSGNLESYQLITEQIPWDLKEGMHDDMTYISSNLRPTMEQKESNITSFDSNEVRLVFRVPPENRFRYRYDTEMSGTHGSLQGIRTGREKSVPTVELLNYPFEALIRVTLVTCQENEYYPHPHSLFVKEKLYQKKIYENWDGKLLTKTGHYSDPHYIRVGRFKNDYIARFEGMCIINSKKENFHSSVREKLQMRLLEYRNGLYKDDSFKADESENLIRSVETAVSAVDVDFVSLCFEAFREGNGKLFPLCQPIYSEAIGNAKSAKTGKLKISRINKCSGSCKGGDEIWLLVEKINKKGLVVRFSEEYNGKVLWESCIEGDDLILHHQYAIIFKTPPYRDTNIISEVEVLMRLERTTQPNQPCDYSEPITFVYEPSKIKNNKGENLYRKESILTPLKQFQTKRPRTESSSPSVFNHQNKRRTDDMELEGMVFEDSDDDIEQLLFDSKDSFELDQAWGKFNVEEFLRFISSDDIDMPIQRDGISHNSKSRRDFFYKLYLLYSKLDENDIKKLTEQISNFRVSKKEVSDGKNGKEKDQVKDAASTLLTLRSKAMNYSNSSINNNNNNDLMTSNVFSENKTNFSGRGSLNKTEPFNQIFESCCESESGVQSPVHMSVIKFNLSKSNFLNQNKSGKNIIHDVSHNEDIIDQARVLEKQLLTAKTIKKEKNSSDSIMGLEKIEEIYEILNRNGSWRSLAELWNCSEVANSAKKSADPARYIFEYIKKVQGELEFETFKNSLEAINEKEALEAFKKLLGDNFHLCNKDL